jgi:predicted type IV restriction endonuclease
MPPRAFYEVNQDSYIYKVNLTPEEKVWQWVLYELISTYMWPVNSIRIEYPLQIGSRNYRADVVISDNSIPTIVIECKKQDHNYGERDQNQALSYADALMAQFAVWTNGTEWYVWRRNRQGW